MTSVIVYFPQTLAPGADAPPSLAALAFALPVLGWRKHVRSVELRRQPEAPEDGAYLGQVERLVGGAFERGARAPPRRRQSGASPAGSAPARAPRRTRGLAVARCLPRRRSSAVSRLPPSPRSPAPRARSAPRAGWPGDAGAPRRTPAPRPRAVHS